MVSETFIEKEAKKTRPGKKIKLKEKFVKNQNMVVDIGTVDNKNCPRTVYLSVSFWVDIRDRSEKEFNPEFDKKISKEFQREIKNIYKKDLYPLLRENPLFPLYEENIFSFDFPENLNYNDKKSFACMELHLHTSNCLHAKERNSVPIPLRNDEKNPLFSELVKLADAIGKSDLMMGRCNFEISPKK